jgi:hypothetical protein
MPGCVRWWHERGEIQRQGEAAAEDKAGVRVLERLSVVVAESMRRQRLVAVTVE